MEDRELRLDERILRSKQVVLQGYSMLPHLHPGKVSVLFLAVCPAYGVGDIVVFRDPNYPSGIVVHRILRAAGDSGPFITKGDNNFFADPPVRAENILGKVEKVRFRKRRRIDHVLSSKRIAAISSREEALSRRLRPRAAKGLHLFFFALLLLLRRGVIRRSGKEGGDAHS